MAPKLSDLFPELKEFSKGVYIYDPTNISTNPTTTRAPSTILLFTWADAHPRHIIKYVEGYKTLYPCARMILVQATAMATFFKGDKSAVDVVQDMVATELFKPTNKTNISELAGLKANGNHKNGYIEPSQESIQTAISTPPSQSRLLVHAFSNSGGINLSAACSAWRSLQQSITSTEPPKPFPLQALILDSTPGGISIIPEFKRWTLGIAASFYSAFPSLPKFINLFLSSIFVIGFFGIPELLGYEIKPSRCRRVINDDRNIPVESKRLYIYSDADPLIAERDVEGHAKEAMERGYGGVELEKFQGSTHVGHMRKDPERYWSVVEGFWRRSGGEDVRG